MTTAQRSLEAVRGTRAYRLLRALGRWKWLEDDPRSSGNAPSA